MPAALAAARKFAVAQTLSSTNQNTLSETRRMIRIQQSHCTGLSLYALLKLANTKPCSGNPHSVRLGVRPIWRLRSPGR